MFYSSTLTVCVLGEAFSALREMGDVLKGSMCSQPITVVWLRGEILGLSNCFFPSVSGLAVETRMSSEGREEASGARQRRKRLAQDWPPPCHTQCHWDVHQCVQL